MPLAILRSGFLLAIPVLGAPEATAQTEFPFAAGTDRAGRAQAVSNAAGRVLIESPEFPRGVWVDVSDEAGQALPGIQVEFQGRADSLVAIWSVDPSGLRQETLLWARPRRDPLRLAIRPGQPAGLPQGLASIDWRVEPGAEELLVRQDGPELIGWEAVAAFLRARWQGGKVRVAVQIDSSTAVAVDLTRRETIGRLIGYLQDRAERSLGASASVTEVVLNPYALDEYHALLEDSIVLITSFVLVPGSRLEWWVLTELGTSSRRVTLSQASALRRLNLGGEQIVDLSPLAALTGLQRLVLDDNDIADVGPLASLTGLRYLFLRDNDIVDVSPLASLTRLIWLYLGNNEIADVSSLAPLTTLGVLDLSENRIVDVTPLASLTNLGWLALWGNEIVDVSPLASMTRLSQLGLAGNRIVDVSPLATLTRLDWLSLGVNEIVDVGPLTSLTGLEWLELGGNGIDDVSALASLTRMEQLGVTRNRIVEISPLTSLTRLELLGLSNNRIVDVDPLASMTRLEALGLGGNEIDDVSSLAPLTRLEWLELGGNKIDEVSPLASLTRLWALGLSSNRIADVSPLAALTSLEELRLSHNQIVDPSPLASLSALRLLDLGANEIKDIRYLVAGKSLTRGDTLYLTDNPLGDLAIKEQIPALRARGVEVIMDETPGPSAKGVGHTPVIRAYRHLADPRSRPWQRPDEPGSVEVPDRLPAGRWGRSPAHPARRLAPDRQPFL